jgi:hypothetical protein
MNVWDFIPSEADISRTMETYAFDRLQAYRHCQQRMLIEYQLRDKQVKIYPWGKSSEEERNIG